MARQVQTVVIVEWWMKTKKISSRFRILAIGLPCLSLLVATCQPRSPLLTAAVPASPPSSNVPSPAVPQASVAPSAVTSSSTVVPSAKPDQAFWSRRLFGFYSSYSNGPQARAVAYRELFAPRLRQFITIRDISLDKAVQTANAYFRDKNDIRYSVESIASFEPDGQSRLTLLVDASWRSPLTQEMKDQFAEASENTQFGNETRLRVDIEYDSSGHVESYRETAAPRRHFRASGKEEPVRAFDAPHSRCETGYDQLQGDEIPDGALVEDLNSLYQLLGCGPGVEIIRKVRYQGKQLWVVEEAMMLVPNPAGGSSLGGITFLERVD